MDVELIRKAFRKKPFAGAEISLASGEVIECPSPEVVVSEDMFVTLDAAGEIVLVDPSAIVTIRALRRRKAVRDPGAKPPSR